MPLYEYKTVEGDTVEVAMTIAEMERAGQSLVLPDGRRARRVISGARVPPTGNWPRKSTAAGVMPEQVAVAEAKDREIGVPTRYDRGTGQAVFESARHQRAWCRAHGWVNRDDN